MWRLRTIIRTEVIVEPATLENDNFIFKVFEVNDFNTENADSVPKNIRYLDVLLKISLLSELSFEHQRLLRLFRNGLNTDSSQEKFMNYFSLFEEIARNESEEMIIYTCCKCKNEINTGRKATNNFIYSRLHSYNIEDKVIEKAMTTRNKIAHGGAKKNKQFLADVQLVASYFEEVAILEIERITKLEVVNRLDAHIMDIPIVKHTCFLNSDGTFDLINSNLTIPVRFIQLKTDGKIEGQSVAIGFPTDPDGRPIIDPFAWPETT